MEPVEIQVTNVSEQSDSYMGDVVYLKSTYRQMFSLRHFLSSDPGSIHVHQVNTHQMSVSVRKESD